MNKIKKLSSYLIIVFLMSLATCNSTDSNIQHKTIIFSQSNIFGLEKEQEVWHTMKNVLNSRDAELNMRMVVGDKDIPFASAYTIGQIKILTF